MFVKNENEYIQYKHLIHGVDGHNELITIKTGSLFHNIFLSAILISHAKITRVNGEHLQMVTYLCKWHKLVWNASLELRWRLNKPAIVNDKKLLENCIRYYSILFEVDE